MILYIHIRYFNYLYYTYVIHISRKKSSKFLLHQNIIFIDTLYIENIFEIWFEPSSTIFEVDHHAKHTWKRRRLLLFSYRITLLFSRIRSRFRRSNGAPKHDRVYFPVYTTRNKIAFELCTIFRCARVSH